MAAKGKLRTIQEGYAVFCPGCEEYHKVYHSWQFNGDFNAPTFSPSLLIRGYSESLKQDFVCHSFIENGAWRFLGDCTHHFKSQIVSLRDEESLP